MVKRDMVLIPAGDFRYRASHRFREGGYQHFDDGPRDLLMREFRIDRFEVTNEQFRHFLDATGYVPEHPHNFLRHWKGGFPDHLEDHPVTWIDLQDARAYASWTGARLPSAVEWQRAAQGDDGRSWPWGELADLARCNGDGQATTAVDAFSGNESPFGVRDMVGNVWEWLDIEISDGWHRWTFLRGGSYYTAHGSRWYAEGGAQPVHHQHKFLLMYPGMDRCSTIGFRCVMSDGPTAVLRDP